MTEKKNMISLENLCDFITHCISSKLSSKYNAFVISDDSDWSTAEIVLLMSKYMNNKRRIFNMPITLLYFFAALLGKNNEIKKLALPLKIDGLQTARILNWRPVQSPQDGIKEAVEFYLNNK
jgi:nucleoside-diphosphate-sugar epimerase